MYPFTPPSLHSEVSMFFTKLSSGASSLFPSYSFFSVFHFCHFLRLSLCECGIKREMDSRTSCGTTRAARERERERDRERERERESSLNPAHAAGYLWYSQRSCCMLLHEDQIRRFGFSRFRYDPFCFLSLTSCEIGPSDSDLNPKVLKRILIFTCVWVTLGWSK